MQKLLRTALLSVFALLVAGGLMAVQAQDASVTVDADQGDNIADGLEQLNTQLGNVGGTDGELVILGNDYRNDGEVVLTEGPGGGSLSNIESLTIVASEDAGTQEVTVESIDYGSANLASVAIESQNGGFIRVTDETSGVPALDFQGGGAVSLDLVSSGVLRIADGATVVRSGNATFASGSADIQYLGSGIPDLTYNLGGQSISATAEFPSGGEVGTLDISNNASGAGLSFPEALSVNTSFSLPGSPADITVGGNLAIPNRYNATNATTLAVEGDFTIESVNAAVGLEFGSGAGSAGNTDVDVSGSLSVNNGGVLVSGSASDVSIDVDGPVTVSGDVSNLPSGDLTRVNSGVFNVGSSSTDGFTTNGSVTVAGELDVAGDANIGDSNNGGVVTADGTFEVGGTLTILDNNSGTALSTNGGTISAGGTNVDGTSNIIEASGAADVSLGNVTFAETDPRFNFSGLNAGMNSGVTVGTVTASFTSGATFIEGGGDFTSNALTLDPADPSPSNDDVSDGDTNTFDLEVRGDESSADYSLGSVSVSTVAENDGTGNFATAVNLNVQAAGSSDEQGRITASGDEFNTVTNVSNGTVDITGSGTTLFSGLVDNDGTLDVQGASTFDAGTKDAVGSNAFENAGTATFGSNMSANGSVVNSGTITANDFVAFAANLDNSGGTFTANGDVTYNEGTNSGAINNDGGTIAIASGQVFTISANDGGDALTGNSASGITGDGTFKVETGNGVTAAIVGTNHGFPATTEHAGGGTMEVQVNDGVSGTTVTGSVEFASLVANADVEFTTPGDDEIAPLTANSLTADASVDFSGATYSGTDDQGTTVASPIGIDDLVASQDTVNFSAASVPNDGIEATNVTLQNEGTLDIGSETLSILRDFTRTDAPNPQLNADGGVVRIVGSENATFDPGDALLTFSGTLEIDKTAQNASVTIQDAVRIDDGGVTAFEPDNSLATTNVTFNDNVIVRNGTFSVDRTGDGTVNVNTGSSELVFRSQDNVSSDAEDFPNVINTDGVFSVTRVANRDLSGNDVLIQGSDTELTVSEELAALGGGFDIQDGAILNPGDGTDDDAPEVIRGFPSGSPAATAISPNANEGGGTFNDAQNTYDLAYEGSGTSTSGSELDPQRTRNLAVRDQVTLQIGEDKVVTGDLTVGPGALISDGDADAARTLTLSGSETAHSIEGIIDGRNSSGTTNPVTLEIAGANAELTGGASSGNDGGSEVQNLTVNASGVTVTDLQQVTNNLKVGSGAGLTIGLADPVPSDGNNSDAADDQAVGGQIKLDGTQFAINSPITVKSGVDADSGTITLGSNDLTVTGGGYAATESVAYSVNTDPSADNRGEFVFSEAGTIFTTDDGNTSATPADIPNVRVEGDGTTGATLGTNVGVDNWLVVNAGDVGTPGIELGSNTLSASGRVVLNAIQSDGTQTPQTVGDEENDDGALDVSNATITVNRNLASGESTDPAGADQGVSRLTVSGGDDVTVESGTDGESRSFYVPGVFTLAGDFGGTFTHDNVEVSVTGSGSIAGSPSGAVVVADGATGDVASGSASFYLVETSRGEPSVALNSAVSFDRLAVTGVGGGGNADLSTQAEDGVLTVNDQLWLNGQLDNQTATVNSSDVQTLALADGVTVRRTEGSAEIGGALTNVPSFGSSLNLTYNTVSSDADFTSGREVPSASSDAAIETVTVNPGDTGSLTLSRVDTETATGNVVVTEVFDLMSGTVTQGTTADASRRLELATGSDDSVVFAQRNGSLEDTDQPIATSDGYTLRYYPDGGDVTTTAQEFRQNVGALEFIDGPVESSSAADLDLHADRTVGSTLVDRSGTDSGTSEFDLSGNTLTASSTANIAAGEVSNSGSATTLVVNGTSGDLAENSDVRINGTLSDALEAAGKTLVTENGSVTGDVTATGDVEVAGSLTSTNFVFAGDVIADAGTFNPTNVTAQGDSDQSVDLPGDLTVEDFAVKQNTPSGSGVPSLAVSNGDIIVDTTSVSSPDDSLGLDLRNGLLVTGENEVDLTSGGFVRNVDQAAGDTSHVVGAVRQNIDSGSRVRTTYPVGSADGSYRFYQLIFPNGISDADIAVSHVDENPGGTSGLPTNDETGVTIGDNYPDYYWNVQTEQNLGLTQNYEVAARANGLTFNSDQLAEDHRLIRRNDVDGSDWGIVGGGADYNNTERSAEGEADIRTTSATGNLTTQGTRFTVGVPTQTTGFQIAGTVSYPSEEGVGSGTPSFTSGEGLGGVEVALVDGGSDVATTTTSSDGSFTFEDVEALDSGNYTVEARTDGDGNLSGGDVDRGVSIADARRIVTARQENPAFANAGFQGEIADVNDNGSANSLDALLVARNVVFGDALSEVPTFFAPSEQASAGDSEVGLQVAAYGDANLSGGSGSNDPNNTSLTASQSAANLSGSLAQGSAQTSASSEAQTAAEDRTIEVPVRLQEAAALGAYEMKLGFPEDAVSFEGASVPTGAEGDLLSKAEDGTVKLGWIGSSSEEAFQVDRGGEVAVLTFALKDGVEETSLSLSLESGQLVGPDASTLEGASLGLPSLSSVTVAPEKFALNGNYPNPVSNGQTQIEMDLPSEGTVTVEVYNALGQRVMKSRKSMQAGSGQTIRINGSDLASGQYFYRVEAELGEKTARETGRITVVN